LSSFSPDPLYQEDAKHRLKAKAGDQVIDFGLLSYSRIDEAGKDPKDSSNPKPLKSNFQFRVKLPEAALLWGTARTHLLTLETMTVSEVQVPDLQALSSADNVVMKLGDNVFRITPVQASIVREFTNSITPLDGAAPVVRVDNSTAVPADVPSDRNNASLANTLEWLQTHLERDASTKDIVVARKAEPISFKSCHIAYRVAPLVRNSPVSATLVYAIFEYQIDLADLNSEAVRVSDQRDFSMVEMTTRDNKPRIKVFKHANDGGITGRTLEDGLSESAVINLKNHDAALQFKTALTHAINLCQPKP
ncbi:MAG TPA: hypothetical protein VE961_26875, partial [Pyrinomonadaceae bacterium]|nr:hypothetical protein [Pyrinomonadaceae bacterium]